jgi:hypothetical protein
MIDQNDPVVLVNADTNWATGVMADILIENGHEPTTNGSCDSCSHASSVAIPWPCELVKLTPQAVHDEIRRTVNED